MKTSQRFSSVMVGIFAPMMLIVWVASITGYLTPFLNGFGVDDQGRLYLGMDRRIEVWENDECIAKITQRKIAQRYIPYKYVFTILDGTRILLQDQDTLYTLDLTGTEIDERSVTWNFLEELIREEYTPYYAADGSWYTYSDGLLGYSITRHSGGQEEEVYHMPYFRGILRLIAFIGFPGFMASTWYFVWARRHSKYVRRMGIFWRRGI